jgi:hypothetical protein
MNEHTTKLRAAANHPFNYQGPDGWLHKAANEIDRLEARVKELEGALQAWEDAVRIDVVMEGPRYIGVDYRRGFIAWEKTLAALTQPAPERTADE